MSRMVKARSNTQTHTRLFSTNCVHSTYTDTDWKYTKSMQHYGMAN